MFLSGELAAKQHRAWSRLPHEPRNTTFFSLLQVRAVGKAEMLGSVPSSFKITIVRGGDRQGSAYLWFLGCEGKTGLCCSLEEG